MATQRSMVIGRRTTRHDHGHAGETGYRRRAVAVGSPAGHEPVAPGRRAFHGFTLIELLVVISIITLLIALLLPALAKARKSALAVQCASGLHQQAIALHAYSNDYERLPPRVNFDRPYATYFQTEVVAGEPKARGLYCLYVGGYFNSYEPLFCPTTENPSFLYDTPQNPWPGRLPYQYYPPFTYDKDPTGKVLLEDLIDRDLPLAFDIVSWALNHDARLWNYLRTDMSVTTYSDTGYLHNYITANSNPMQHSPTVFEAVLRDLFH